MNDLEERNIKLEEGLAANPIDDNIATLKKGAQRQGRIITGLIISVTLDIALTIVISFLSVRTHHLASQAESNHDALVTTCQSSNEARANNKQLWTYLLGLPTPQTLTLQEKQARDQFQAFVDKTFAPRDCTQLNTKQP